MNIYVYEDQAALNLEPLSLTRPVFDIRIGSETFLDRIQFLYPNATISVFVRESIADFTKQKYPNLEVNPKEINDGLWLLGNVIWGKNTLSKLNNDSCAFYYKNQCIGANLNSNQGKEWLDAGGPTQSLPQIKNKIEVDVTLCQFLWEIIHCIPNTIEYEMGTFNNTYGEKDGDRLSLVNPDHILINKATIQPNVTINATYGPVLIDSGVEIYGPSYLEGPIYIGSDTIIKPLTQIKNSVIGPVCKVGGEVDSVIMQGYANKVHDGHLGDAFLGEWVNLGAGTNNSNLKNNYTSVKVQINGKSVDSDRLHIGCFIGDYVKTAIGTLLNTGTVIGPGSMIASEGFPPKTIKPFTWFVKGKHKNINIEKFIATETLVKKRRGQEFSKAEKELVQKIII